MLQARVPSPSQAAAPERRSDFGAWPCHPSPSIARAHGCTRLRKGPSRLWTPTVVTIWVTQSLRKCGSCLSTRMRRPFFSTVRTQAMSGHPVGTLRDMRPARTESDDRGEGGPLGSRRSVSLLTTE